MPPASSTDFGPTTQQFDTTSTRDALPSGTRLGGYQIIDVLARGRGSIIYLALDSSLQRQVAIKEYLPFALAERRGHPHVVLKSGADSGAYAAGLADFLSEGNLLTRLDHPSIARVHSFWEENSTAYMVMPYYAGQTLAAALKAMPRPPDEAWLRALLAPLLSGLNVLHNAQCYHRNITPDNIFLLEDGRPVLLDFSASNRVIGDKTLPLTVRLNPAYAAIEQYPESATLSQGPWTDLYALAAVLHFAITRQLPALATVRAVNDPQRPLAEAVRTLQKLFLGLQYSDTFLSGIDKALSVKPRGRPRNAADFMLSLDRAPNAIVAPLPEPLSTPSAFIPRDDRDRGDSVFQGSHLREDWVISPERSVRVPEPRRSRAPLWLAGLCTIALAAAGGWWWTTHMQPTSSRSAANTPAANTVAVAPPLSAMPADAQASAAADTPDASPAPVPSGDVPRAETPPSSEPAVTAAPTTDAAIVEAPIAPKPVPPVATESVATPPVPTREPASSKKAAKDTLTAAVPVEPDNPRALCGTRTNFALVYCMQTQCNRPRFAQHAQCTAMKQRGEIN